MLNGTMYLMAPPPPNFLHFSITKSKEKEISFDLVMQQIILAMTIPPLSFNPLTSPWHFAIFSLYLRYPRLGTIFIVTPQPWGENCKQLVQLLIWQIKQLRYLQKVNGSGGSVPGIVVTSVPSLKTRVYFSLVLKHLLNLACFSTAASRISFAEEEPGTFSGSESLCLILIFMATAITAIVILTSLSFGFVRIGPLFCTKKELLSFSLADLKALELLSEIFVADFDFPTRVAPLAVVFVFVVSLALDRGAADKTPCPWLSMLITTGCPH